MEQIEVELMKLPEVDGFKYVVMGIDNFTKWTEARPLKNKTAEAVALFLYYDIICRHGCPKIRVQIKYQCKEFVDELNEQMLLLTKIKRRFVTSTDYTLVNSLVERQNRTIKNGLLKVLLNNHLQWPYILEWVLFKHRTEFTQFKMLYKHDAALPVDVVCTDECLQVNDKINNEKVIKNVNSAQSCQRYLHAKQPNTLGYTLKEGDKVFARNLQSKDGRKGAWSELPWTGPYEIVSITSRNFCILKNELGILKKRIHLKNLKIYKDSIIDENDTHSESKNENSSTNDVEYVKSFQLDTERMFNPVTESWQIEQSKIFNLEVKNKFNFKYNNNILGEPTKCVKIVGDGNCLFRCFSQWISGTQDYHLKIRRLIAEVI